MDESDMAPQKYFSDAAPESARAGRQSTTGLPAQRPGQSDRPGTTAAELRLYVWSMLPERHRSEVCRQIRACCETFIASVRVDRSQRKSETDRLVSEVVAHLLRATSAPREETAMDRQLHAMGKNPPSEPGRTMAKPDTPMPWLAKGVANEHDPTRDARVRWVVEDTCNRPALFHRYEDMRRRDRGGKWDGSGYPLMPVDAQTIEQLSGHYDPTEDETDALHAEDSRRAWAGLVAFAAHQFGPNDDVVALVQVLAEDRDTQDSFGSQWPIGQIVRALNRRQAQTSWNDDRVDNAKKRLTKCIAKIKQANGLDAVDLRALLVRYAREHRLRTELKANA
jgi:hypothetical protein